MELLFLPCFPASAFFRTRHPISPMFHQASLFVSDQGSMQSLIYQLPCIYLLIQYRLLYLHSYHDYPNPNQTTEQNELLSQQDDVLTKYYWQKKFYRALFRTYHECIAAHHLYSSLPAPLFAFYMPSRIEQCVTTFPDLYIAHSDAD